MLEEGALHCLLCVAVQATFTWFNVRGVNVWEATVDLEPRRAMCLIGRGWRCQSKGVWNSSSLKLYFGGLAPCRYVQSHCLCM